MCEEFVSRHLKAPSQAEFIYGSEVAVHHSDGRYTVTGEVDVPNAFGVMIRTRYRCELHYGGNDMWYLDDILIE